MVASKAKIAANARYNKRAYDRIEFKVPKGRKEEIQAAATAAGESLNSYVVTAVDARMSAEEAQEVNNKN